jgi:hypothetical protein
MSVWEAADETIRQKPRRAPPHHLTPTPTTAKIVLYDRRKPVKPTSHRRYIRPAPSASGPRAGGWVDARHGAASRAAAAYGKRVLANSLRIKYSAASIADPARTSASHISCLMVIRTPLVL